VHKRDNRFDRFRLGGLRGLRRFSSQLSIGRGRRRLRQQRCRRLSGW